MILCKRRLEKVRISQVKLPREYVNCQSDELFVLGKCFKMYWRWDDTSKIPGYIGTDINGYFVRLFSIITRVTLREYHSFMQDHFFTRGINSVCLQIRLSPGLPYDISRFVFIRRSSCQSKNASRIVSFISMPKNQGAVCQSNQAQCGDGTCVTQEHICSNARVCMTSECSCHAIESKINSPRYCHTGCIPGSCSCPRHHFQCISGKCIQMHLICDGEINCSDASDEFCGKEITSSKTDETGESREVIINEISHCLGYRCQTGICIELKHVNDLLPDCPGTTADDEPFFHFLRYRNIHQECRNPNHLPCVAGLPVCYPINKLCLFDVDENGNTKWCRDGAHLGDCAFIDCTNSYKCPGSYCIPFHHVCDGKPDCINCQDEVGCHEYICKGLLRCRGTTKCVHPGEVCDGVSHCPDADDEKLCDLGSCPYGCDCLSYSILCNSSTSDVLPILPSAFIRHLTVVNSLNNSHLMFTNICSQEEFLFLNISRNHIAEICKPLKYAKKCRLYNRLAIFDLSHNEIRHLLPLCFKTLTALIVISLAHNPIHFVHMDSFVNPLISYISLRGTAMKLLKGYKAANVPRLYSYDITETHLNYIDVIIETLASHVIDFRFDDPWLCCIFTRNRNCMFLGPLAVPCPTLTSQFLISYALLCYGGMLIFFDIVALYMNNKFTDAKQDSVTV